mmetsp:Transcript_26102/g.68517  ORF Transcript_26102/g.68517 Transcript_26102/m.68517 type:complete len:239 (+) Transcript_26102:53-769(+)
MASEADRVRDVRFIQTCGQRLALPDEVLETAARGYHRVHATALGTEVDPVLLCITMLYATAKATDHPRDLRDCITVGLATVTPASDGPIPIDEKYRDIRESVIATEQLVLRALRFDLVPDPAPWQLLLLFLRSFERDGVASAGGRGPDATARLARTCTAVLNDTATSAAAAAMPPDHLAAAVLHVGAALEEAAPADVLATYVGLLVPALCDEATLAKSAGTVLSVYERPELAREDLRR